MVNLKWYERLIVAIVVVGIGVPIYIFCFDSNNWIEFSIGAVGYQIVDYIIAYFRFKN